MLRPPSETNELAAQEIPRRQSESVSRPAPFQVRATHLVKKLGNLTGKLGIRVDKSREPRSHTGSSPYRQTQSMEGSRKPFVSQPMLPLHPPEHDDIDQSSSPGTSSFGTSTASLIRETDRRSSSRTRFFTRGVSSPTLAPENTVPRRSAEASRLGTTGSRMGNQTGRSRPRTAGDAPVILVSSPPASNLSPSSWKPGRRSIEQGKPLANPSVAAGVSFNRSGPTPNHDFPSARVIVTEPETLGPSQPEHAENFREGTALNTMIKSPVSSPSAPAPTHHTAPWQNTSSHPAGAASRRPAPRLASLPPLSTTSFMDTEEQRARLSPSIITRPPPMPILHLPALPPQTPTATSPRSASARQGISRLMSMPSLPREGADERGNDPDHEHSGLGDSDEDEDGDDDEDDDDPDAGAIVGVGSDDEGGDTEEAVSSSSSHRLVHPSLGLTGVDIPSPELFPVNTGRSGAALASSLTQLRIPLSASVPSSTPAVAGKAREREDATTPKATQRRDYFSQPRLPQESLVSPQTPKAPEYLQVPRAEDQTPQSSVVGPSQSPLTGRTAQAYLSPLPSPRPALYHQASKSMINLLSPPKDAVSVDGFSSRTHGGVDVKGKGKAPASASLLHAPQYIPSSSKERDMVKETKPAPQDLDPPLRRQRSMPTFHTSGPPPPYPTFFMPHDTGHAFNYVPMPRDEEGMECLPDYSNDLHLVAIMPRKLEFMGPGVQAKDRKWRRVLCVLEGTAFRVYECPSGISGVSVLGKWWEKKVGVGDVTIVGGNFGAQGGVAGVDPRDAVKNMVRPVKWDEEERALEAAAAEQAGLDPRAQSQQQSHRSKKQLASSLLHPSRSPAPTSNASLASHPRSSTSSRPPSPLSSTPRSSFTLSRPSSRLSNSGSTSSHFLGSVTLPPSAQSSTTCVASSPPSTMRATHLRTHSRSGSASSAQTLPDPNPKDLLRAYSLQNAESGLASDYRKRQNVIRVRMEGEQFLLQMVDVASVIEWIEGLQAGANISLDLDERPMPKGPIFPRRRRRRRPRPPEESATAPAP